MRIGSRWLKPPPIGTANLNYVYRVQRSGLPRWGNRKQGCMRHKVCEQSAVIPLRGLRVLRADHYFAAKAGFWV